MKIIDKNGRLFGKVSVIDVVVVLIVAVLAVALHAKTNTKDITGNTVADTTITYEITAQGIPTYVADAVRENDEIHEVNQSTGGNLGKIVSIETAPGTRLTSLPDGSVETIPVEDCVDMTLTIEGTGILKDGHYMLNRIYELGVNASREFGTHYARFVGTVTEIQK